MSKIVILNIPAHGHVNATLPVVQELIRRGEQVIYYNTEEFRPQIERAGAQFRAYPASALTPTTIAAALADGNIANVSILLLKVTGQLVPFTLEELRRESPDLVVFDATVVWGRIACALLNLPSAATITTFVLDLKAARLNGGEMMLLLRQVLPRFPRQLFTRFRLARRYGELAFATFPMRGDQNIVFTARELQPDTPLLNETFRFVGPSIDPQTRGGDFPFEALTAEKVIYISLGTVHQNVDFFQQCFEAFRDYPAQFILSAGKDTNIEALHAPANFIVRPTVPQLEVLQRADAFITHGGINGIHEGLYYGVPLVIIPHQFEQLLNARCVEAQGAGLTIRDQVTGGRVTAAQLRQALDTVLSDAKYREAALEAQAVLRATGGYRQAADELQAFIAERQGVS
jgi:MGT family glycosyltransferase